MLRRRRGAAGMSNVHIERVVVGREGGLEAAARTARYGAIERRVAAEGGVNPQILTGHTMDDQAETVLLALARGSGARALVGDPGAARAHHPAVPVACGARTR